MEFNSILLFSMCLILCCLEVLFSSCSYTIYSNCNIFRDKLDFPVIERWLLPIKGASKNTSPNVIHIVQLFDLILIWIVCHITIQVWRSFWRLKYEIKCVLYSSLTNATFHSVPHRESARLGGTIRGARQGAPLHAPLGLAGASSHDGVPGRITISVALT